MFKLAVTGGIACGKSAAGRILSDLGVHVREADEVAHEQMAPGTGCHQQIVREFGAGVLDPDGAIDRRRLGDCVFFDSARRDTLNGIVHPAVWRELSRWMCELGRAPVVAAVIPLLYETGMEGGWDAVACVASPREDQMTRLLARGLSREKADAMVAAQLPVDEKMTRSDYVLFNCGTIDLLGAQVRRMLGHIVET